MLTTPHHISQKIDSILDNLNCKWDLQLPRLYGLEARDALDDTTLLARRCSSRIRYLCYRSEASIDSCIAEFEDQTDRVLSRKDVKGAQAYTILQPSTVSRSFLQKDKISASGGLSTDQRECLLKILSDLLDDECKLARDSESYQRTSACQSSKLKPQCPPTEKIPAVRPRTPSPTGNLQHDHKIVAGNTSPTKKRRILDEAEASDAANTPSKTNKSATVQQKLSRYFSKSKETDDTPELLVKDDITYKPILDGSLQNTKSFVSESSDAKTSFATTTTFQSGVFSQANSQSSNSSISLSHDKKSKDEESQDYFPTQDAMDYFADQSFTSELNAADHPTLKTNFTFDLLEERTPFIHAQCLPEGLPFWLCWELCRVAISTELSVCVLSTALVKPSGIGLISYDEFWSNIRKICKDHGKSLPDKSDVRSWMQDSYSYQSPKGKTASFTFNLAYVEDRGPYLWKLELNPIRVDQGNRIHRKFGADRHVVGTLNYFDKSTLPRWISQQRGFDEEVVLQKVSRWLATSNHHIAGRNWRGFYLESVQKKNNQPSILRVNFIAVDGIGISKSPGGSNASSPAINVGQLIDWHITTKDNLDSTDLKLFSRFGLALSKTRATMVLKQSHFRHLWSPPPIMNDGCALMSLAMAKAVWDICGDGSVIPSVFQARIGGAKGLWMIDYRDSDISTEPDALWIQISDDSQLKIKPHPADHGIADETQRCFEVLKWSKDCVPGHLNIQLINILADRGVSRSILRQIVHDDIEKYVEAARAAMKDPRMLQAWLQVYHSGDRSEDPVAFEYGLPDAKADAVNLLVQCGFSAANNEHLRLTITDLMTQHFNTYVDKLRIELPYSTTVFCIPDPYHVLEADEVYMGFSRPWEICETGITESGLIDIDVLVARNPAALASDIQKRRAVYKHELRRFRDVIVFPTRGDTPLASLLSGGDYDGDLVTVIWDPRLVNNFNNVDKPVLPTLKQCGLSKKSRMVSDIFKSPSLCDSEVDDFLTHCFHFNARSNRLGMCTNEHERLVYSGAKLSDPGAVLLATLAGYLVDANKQGLALADEAWFRTLKLAQAGRKIDDLAYRKGKLLPRRRDDGECVNIMDHLKFDVAMKRKDDVLKEFETMLQEAIRYDSELTLPYKREAERALKCKETGLVLTHLKDQLSDAHRTWVLGKRRRENQEVESGEFRRDVRHVSSMIKDIDPPESDCQIFVDFLREDFHQIDDSIIGAAGRMVRNHLKGTRWSLLRASTMYHLFNRSRIVWWTVGDELGRIKCRSQGSTRELTPAMHHTLKTDTKLIKWLTEKAMRTGADDDD